MRVLPLASDADPIRGIALLGKLDMLPVRSPEEIETQRSLQDTSGAAGQTVEAVDLSDEELVARVRTQDSEALDLLFTRYSRLVYSIALRILHDAGEAEEVVQECFLYVFRKACAFEPSRGSAKVWIVQVAYSRARDRKAHLCRRGFYLRRDLEPDGLEGPLAGQGDVEREIGARIDFESLHCAFEELTQVQRKTLELFYFEGMNLREISELLHEPFGNVRHHFYRGLERLRKSALAERLRDYRNAEN